MDRFRVLVVEDSGVSVAAIKLAIGNDPMLRFVGAAATALEAVYQSRVLEPDVITLDLDIPGGGALQALTEIKAAIAKPVVIVSASTYEGSPVIPEVLRLGADACFDKRHVLSEVKAFLAILRSAAQDNVLQVPRYID